MTRKAARKRRRQAAQPSARPSTTRPGAAWMTVGTLVASTAITGLLPAAASASEPFPRSSIVLSANVRRLIDLAPSLFDSRTDVIATVLRSAKIPDATSPSSAVAQVQGGPPSTMHRFDIPAGPLSDILGAFERTTGVHRPRPRRQNSAS